MNEHGNANQLQGTPISQTPPSDNQVLTFDAATSQAQWETGGGSGTVTSVSVVSANGFAGTVATATTTPAITLTTTVTGILKGNGTAISAAVADTDYLTPGTAASTYALLGANTDITSLRNTSLSAGRDADNFLSWSTDNQLDIRINAVTTSIVSISTGAGDNDKLVTQGYVDDNAGGLNFGDAIDGTTGTGISINDSGSPVQATGATTALSLGVNFNTNSAFNYIGANLTNQNNAGAGLNTGFYMQNVSTTATLGTTNSGAGFYVNQAGVDGTAIVIYGQNDVNASTNGLQNITLSNSQTGASTLFKANTGTSTQDHLAAHFTGTRFSLKIDDADQAPGTTTNKLYSVAGTLYWNGTDLTAGGGLTWGDSITDTSGTGITITAGNSSAASTICESIVIGNTQSNIITGLNIDTGTSGQTVGLKITALNAGSNSTGNERAGFVFNCFSSDTQLTSGSFLGWVYGTNFNENSIYNATFGRFLITENVGVGRNSGFYIVNQTTDFLANAISNSNPGTGLTVHQTGVDGTAMSVYGANNVNSSTNGLVNYTLSNTQSGASVMQKTDLGTSAQANIGELINAFGANTGQRGIHIDLSTTGTGTAIEISGSNASARVFNIDDNLTQASGTATGTTTKEIKITIDGTDYVIDCKSQA